MPLPPHVCVFSDRFVTPSLLLQLSVFTFIIPLVPSKPLSENESANRLAVSSVTSQKQNGEGEVNAELCLTGIIVKKEEIYTTILHAVIIIIRR